MENNGHHEHATAVTSKECFIDLSNEGRLIDEKNLVYKAILDYGPVTSRKLSELIKKERTNITRSIYDLLHEIQPSIKIAFLEKCPTTNRKVSWYAPIDWKPFKTFPDNKLVQAELL